jgi:hypothetical protein
MAKQNWYISKDVLWKGIIHELFDEFLAFYFPDEVDLVNFSRKPVFLDKELAEISPISESGENRADMLVKVFLKDGNEKWLLIHIEIQGYEDKLFELRMFQYYYRIWDKYQQPIASIAIFTDEKEDFHPQKYSLKTWKTHLFYEFHSVKIRNMNPEELAKSNNPFAIVCETVLLAILKKKEKEEVVLELKTELFRKLLQKGYDKNYIRVLARFLEYYKTFRNFALNLQFEENMDKITSLLSNPYPQTMDEFILMDIERQGIKQGLEQGEKKGEIKGEIKGKMEGIELTALNVLQNIDMPIEEAVRIFGLPKEKIIEMKRSIKGQATQKISILPQKQSYYQRFMNYVRDKWALFFRK